VRFGGFNIVIFAFGSLGYGPRRVVGDYQRFRGTYNPYIYREEENEDNNFLGEVGNPIIANGFGR
jgi:hypothetical protein